MSQDIIIDLRGATQKPDKDGIAQYGPRRLVKFIPMPGNYAAPAIWTSPQPAEANIEGQIALCRICIVLVSKNPAETMRVTVPEYLYNVLPEAPVEW